MKIKSIILVSFSIILSATTFAKGSSRSGGYVKGYTRKDGTSVSGHFRRGTGTSSVGISKSSSSSPVSSYSTSSPSINKTSLETPTTKTTTTSTDSAASSEEIQKIIDEANSKLAKETKKD